MIPPGELNEADVQSCDWGDCNAEAVAVRWAEDLGEWLSVCVEHEQPNLEARIAAALDIHAPKDFLRPSGRTVQLCKVCNVMTPCATRKALEGTNA